MNKFEQFDESQFETLTHGDRDKLTSLFSSRDAQAQIYSFGDTLGQKVSQMDNKLVNDPDLSELKQLVGQIKAPLEQDLIEQQNQLNMFRIKMNELGDQRLGNGEDSDFETRLAEIKKKLNTVYGKMIELARTLSFADLGKVEYPSKMRSSFDR